MAWRPGGEILSGAALVRWARGVHNGVAVILGLVGLAAGVRDATAVETAGAGRVAETRIGVTFAVCFGTPSAVLVWGGGASKHNTAESRRSVLVLPVKIKLLAK